MLVLKKIITILLTVAICLGCVTALPLTATAAQKEVAQVGTESKSENYNKNYTLTGNGAADMVAIARAQVGMTKGQLGYHEDWCADFVSDCAKLAGQSAAVPFNGGVSYLYNAVVNAGGYQVSSAQAGDLVFYTCTKGGYMCHVGIMTDSVNSVQGNVPSVKAINYNYYLDGNASNNTDKCYTVKFIRPAYGGSTVAFGTPENLGDNFYASLTKSDCGVYIANVNGNVELADHTTLSDNAHIWNFVRQSDNSYVLYNCASGSVMDVANAGKVSGTNISMCPFLDNDAQKWYFYKQSDGSYKVRPKLCYLVLDVNGAYNDYGTNIQLWESNSSSAQKFTLIIQEKVQKPVFSVEAGDYRTLTTFRCETGTTPVNYELVINSMNGDAVVDTITIPMVLNDVFMYELPEGVYQAYAQVSNGYSTAKSDVVTFEVAGKPQVGEDGWTYSNKLYSEITSSAYDIEYLHTYSAISADSPGEGWTKGEFAKTEYVNSGEPYWSEFELSVSDTRVLVDYMYYHYCGPSAGNNANFTISGNYIHYDSVSKNGVYEYSVNTDYDDSRYKYYHLKRTDGSDLYCSSGNTCDGSFGSHGNRSCYWYKSCLYQNKVAVDYYYYTKPSVWTQTPDDTAVSVTYRYKLKESGNNVVLGDANGDGKISVVDATTIQKHCASIINLTGTFLNAADADNNGRINVADATRIQKFIAGIISKL